MKPTELHQLALRLHETAHQDDALRVLRDILAEDSSVWNDWATIHFRRGDVQEAEAGYRLALKLDAADPQAAANLGALLIDQERFGEALPFLENGSNNADAGERAALAQLSDFAKDRISQLSGVEQNGLQSFLQEYVSDDRIEQTYFNRHVHRYVATLQSLPTATKGQRVLELGAGFHHLTAALKHCKQYADVRCTDVCNGPAQIQRTLRSRAGGPIDSFTVDNFPLEMVPWPYASGEFEAVVCCQILERLHSDPMALLEEINRVLKPDGCLLLTTPNLASARGVERALVGESPYCYGKFGIHGRPTDRHNREYTAQEVARLGKAAGFALVSLKTFDFYSSAKNSTLILLARQGFPLALRGDTTILLARKVHPVRERYPQEFYAVQSVSAPKAQSTIQAEAATPTQDLVAPLNVLLVHEIVPQHDCSGADLRIYELVRELCRDGHHVTFLARMDRCAERYAPDLEALGAKVVAGDLDRLKHCGEDRQTPWNLEALLKDGAFDVAILSFWYWNQISVIEHYLDEIRQYSPRTCAMVLSEDRHGERERRASELSGLISDVERGEEYEQRELECYQQADLLLYVSEADHKHFRSLLPELRAEHLPTLVDAESTSEPYAGRSGVLFLGNFENLANRDALQWLLERVLPILRQQEPTLKLYVAGNQLTPELCPSSENVINLGKLGALGPEFAKRLVFLGPIRYGTGLITKNMIAAAHGLPVVTTTVGAEGLQLLDGQHAIIADDPDTFAAGILRLVREEPLWTKISEGGRNYIRGNFNQERLRAQLRKIMAMARSIPRKPYDPKHQWSYRKVEQHIPQTLTQRPAHYRAGLRQLGYWQLGNKLLSERKYAEALEQYRHIFTAQRGEIPPTVLHTRLLEEIALCYEALGNDQGASRCHAALKAISENKTAWRPARERANKMARRRSEKQPELSVVIPTCNRKEILLLCLAALSMQSLPARFWEVVVVDDGSTDGTEAMLREMAFPFGPVCKVRQENQGAGAARRAGVAAARGAILLFLNDDSVPSVTLLAEHLSAHRSKPQERLAILGAFLPSPECHRHALSLWIHRSTFLFPQNILLPGYLYDASHFITCNLSVAKSAVLETGSFDPIFRVGEDTELGTRLAAKGYRVKYHPVASAYHEHANFTTADLLARARAYAPTYMALFKKHPQLLKGAKTPFGTLSASDFKRMETEVAEKGAAVKEAILALQALDAVDLFELCANDQLNNSQLQEVMDKLAQLVPLVYWHTLFETFLKATAEASKTLAPTAEAELAGARR